MASADVTGRFLSIGAPSAVAYRSSGVDLKAVESDWTTLNALYKELKFTQDGGTVWDPQLTKPSLLSRLSEFFATPASLHVLIYLGHGREPKDKEGTAGGDWVLVAPNRIPATVGLEEVWSVWLQTQASRGAGHLLIYMDSCFAGFWIDRAAKTGLPCSIQCATDRGLAIDGFFTERWLQFARGQIDEAALLKMCDMLCTPRAYSEGKQSRLLGVSVTRLKSVFALIDSKPKVAPAAPTVVAAAKPHVDTKVNIHNDSNVTLKNLQQRLTSAINFIESNAELKSALGSQRDGYRNQLIGQRDAVTQLLEHHRIAVVGQTGAGKTTLINNILGVPLLVSTPGQVQAITWCPTSISTDIDAPTGTCRITRVYYSGEEWIRRRGILLEVNGRIKAKDEKEAEPDPKEIEAKCEQRLNQAAIKALYSPENRKKLGHLKSGEIFETDDVRQRLGKAARTEWVTLAEAQRYMKEFTDIAKDNEDGKFNFNEWPIVKEFHISGAFPALPPYVTIIDTPGTNDRDNKRNQICDFQSFIARSTRVWYVGGNEDRLQKSMHRDIVELNTCGVFDRVCLVRTKSENVKLADFKAWVPNLQAEFKKLTKKECKIDAIRVASDFWKAYCDLDNPNADQEEAKDLVKAAKRYGYPDPKSTGIPLLRAQLEVDSKAAVQMMYDASFIVSDILNQIYSCISDPAAGTQAVDKKLADAVINTVSTNMTAAQKALEAELAKSASLPGAAEIKLPSATMGKPDFKVDQALRSLLEGTPYNTLQAFFRRRGDWQPRVVDWIWRAFLTSSKIEEQWVYLFDTAIPVAARSFCSTLRETSLKAVDKLPASDALHRLTLPHTAAVYSHEAERRFLQIAFTARQGLQQSVGRCIHDFLVQHPTFFGGEDSGQGCRIRMQDYILRELHQNMDPLYDHVVKSIIGELDAGMVAPVKQEAKLVTAHLMNHYTLAFASDAKKKPLSAALLAAFGALGCSIGKSK